MRARLPSRYRLAALCAALTGMVLAAPAAAVPRPELSGERLRLVRAGEDAIDRWDAAEASEIAAKMLAKSDSDPAGIRLAALAAFYSGDYEEAKNLASKATKKAYMEPGLFEVIHSTYQVTKGWKKSEGEHFVLYYKDGPDEVLVPYALQALEKARTAFEKDLGWSSPGKIRVEIYPSQEDFTRVSTLTREEIQTTGTIALCKFNRLMITSPRALVHGYPWMDTLAHEYTHLVIVKASHNTVPIWLHEGIAKFSESRWRRDRGGELDPSISSVLAEALEKKHFIAFERMHPSIAKLPTAWEAHLAFAEVVSAVSFIEERAGDDGIKRVLAAMRDGASVTQAVSQVTQIPWSEFDGAWKTYLEKQNLVFQPELAVMPLALKDSPKKEGEDAEEQYHGLEEKARRLMHIGDLLRNEGRLQAAVIEYRKASSAQGTRAPMIGHKIGKTLLRQGKLDQATREFRQVLALYPDYAPALTDLADVRLQIGDVGEARIFAWKALTVNPYDPRVHELLGEACSRSGDDACAQQEKRAVDQLVYHYTGGRHGKR